MSRQAAMAARAAQNDNVNQAVTQSSQLQAQSQPADNQQGQVQPNTNQQEAQYDQKAFEALESRVAALELTIVDLMKQLSPTGQQTQATAGQPKLEVLPFSKPGYTGKAQVFFIYKEDGTLDMDKPYYSPNIAKNCGKYEVIPSWVKDGIYDKPL